MVKEYFFLVGLIIAVVLFDFFLKKRKKTKMTRLSSIIKRGLNQINLNIMESIYCLLQL